ncbi:MAG: bacillithiol biosynthesis BshC [Planctomycetota bacterium]
MKLRHHPGEHFAFNESYRRLLEDPASLHPFVTHATPEDLPVDRAPWRRTGIERSALIEILRRHQAAAPAVLEKLAKPETLVVVTGQQPGLKGGPLFSLYKAWGALGWSRRLEAQWQTPVVAVFCNMSEDHDWAEANALVLREGNQWVKQPVPPDVPGAHLCDKAYPGPGGDTFGTAFTRHLRDHLKDEPLVILEPSWFREMLSPFMARMVMERSGFRQDLRMATSALKLSGLPVPLEESEALHLCHAHQGKRTRVRDAGSGRFEAGAKSWAREADILSDLKTLPRDFSCNVVSRVLSLRQLLPVVAEVLGPSETAYHLQLQPLHARAGLVAPLLLPRPHVVVLREREAKRLQKLGLEPWQVGTLPPRGGDPRLKEAVGDRVEGIRRLWAALEQDVSHHGDLGRRLARRRGELEKILAWVPGAFEEAAALKDAQGLEAWKALQDWLFPLGEPQERALSLEVLSGLTGPYWEDLRRLADPTVRMPLWATCEQGDVDAH